MTKTKDPNANRWKMQRFKRWIVKNYGLKVWNKYVENVRKSRGFLRSVSNTVSLEYFVSGVFFWEATPQRHGHWSEINKKWRAHCDAYKRKTKHKETLRMKVNRKKYVKVKTSGYRLYECPYCKMFELKDGDRYCPRCGSEVEWDK